MKVFISWSGDASKELAQHLESFIKVVVQLAKPFVSASGIEPGEKWISRLGDELSDTKVGIVCLTPSNLNSRWLHYEAGALAKSLDGDERVAVCRLNVSTTDVEYPLAQFQSNEATYEGIWSIAQMVNRALGEKDKLDEETLKTSFSVHWPSLEKKIDTIDLTAESGFEKRDPALVLEELVQLSRQIGQDIISLKRSAAQSVSMSVWPANEPAGWPKSYAIEAFLEAVKKYQEAQEPPPLPPLDDDDGLNLLL